MCGNQFDGVSNAYGTDVVNEVFAAAVVVHGVTEVPLVDGMQCQ